MDASKSHHHLRLGFDSSYLLDTFSFLQTRRHYYSMFYPKTLCNNINYLLFLLFIKQKRATSALPPTFYLLHGHLVMSHYFIRLHFNLVEDGNIGQNNMEQYGWNIVMCGFLSCVSYIEDIEDVTKADKLVTFEQQRSPFLIQENALLSMQIFYWYPVYRLAPLKHKCIEKTQFSNFTF